MLKILHFIFGRLYFQVKGYQTERFLNLCAKNHLVLWELKPVSDGYVFFIRRSSYQMLEALAEKANVDLALQGQKGLPYFLKEHKKRKILFFFHVFVRFNDPFAESVFMGDYSFWRKSIFRK